MYGIEAAARYYFNTTAAALTPAQSASLLAIVAGLLVRFAFYSELFGGGRRGGGNNGQAALLIPLIMLASAVVYAVSFLRPDFDEGADAPLALIARHAAYVAERIGVAHVGLGSDFDGTTVPDALGSAMETTSAP